MGAGPDRLISDEDLKRAITTGCGDHSCRFVKPWGQGTNGGCRCFGKRSTHALLCDLLAELADARGLL